MVPPVHGCHPGRRRADLRGISGLFWWMDSNSGRLTTHSCVLGPFITLRLLCPPVPSCSIFGSDPPVTFPSHWPQSSQSSPAADSRKRERFFGRSMPDPWRRTPSLQNEAEMTSRIIYDHITYQTCLVLFFFFSQTEFSIMVSNDSDFDWSVDVNTCSYTVRHVWFCFGFF